MDERLLRLGLDGARTARLPDDLDRFSSVSSKLIVWTAQRSCAIRILHR